MFQAKYYDIIFSLTFHTTQEELEELVIHINDNISDDISYFIIINTSRALTNIKLKAMNYMINKYSFDKKKLGSDLFKAHITNYELTRRIFNYKFFILLASSCYFFRKMKHSDLKLFDEYFTKYTYTQQNQIDIDRNWCFYTPALNNKPLNVIFEKMNIKLVSGQHEGLVLTKDMIEFIFTNEKKYQIYYYCKDNNSLPLEEIIFASFIKNYYNIHIPLIICKVFWHNTDYLATTNNIDELAKVTNSTFFMVKRVDTNIKNYIKTNKYIL